MLKVILTTLAFVALGIGCAESGQSPATKDGPSATPTAVPTPTPEPVNLTETKSASMWISLSKGDYFL